ncbi:MAG: mucoidy inhibitor MuiA family protein [Prevotellaceae bacterium]|nr:mucoidy inhibitor MuiA family protein [Prevotellaceae bacterium]
MEIKAQQDNATAVKSTVSGVTVFIRGAEVQREGMAQLRAGAQQLLFDNLPQNINAQSIQVSGQGNFTILGVIHRINHLKPAEKSKEVIDLEKSEEELNDKIEQNQYALNNFVSEEKMLEQNQSIGGSNTGVKVSDLIQFSDFYRSRLENIAAKKLEIAKKMKELSKEKDAVTRQLNELRAKPEKATSSVIVNITAPAAAQAKITVSYLVYNAGWSPSYDLRAKDIKNPVELTYKANVYQSTGEDWKNIKPTLSTGNPTVNSTKPTLDTWYLSFYEPAPVSNYQSFNSVRVQRSAVNKEVMADDKYLLMEDAVEMSAPATLAELTVVQESQTSVEFTVDVPYDIAGDGQPQAVELAKHSLPATYEYYAVRKLEKDVFLLAQISGWERLNLLSGNANIFFEDRYVGESFIETRKTDDKLSLSLGRDHNITVTRIRKKDFSEKQFLGSNITETREWDLTVHNKKKDIVTIIVEDQIPVSTDKEIKVEAINISDATKDNDTGKLTWRLNLKPAESQSMNVKYSVKYPKNKKVILE